MYKCYALQNYSIFCFEVLEQAITKPNTQNLRFCSERSERNFVGRKQRQLNAYWWTVTNTTCYLRQFTERLQPVFNNAKRIRGKTAIHITLNNDSIEFLFLEFRTNIFSLLS
ncbi:MAG: hypothetical protein RJA07_1546 [Bacteroidota bacterium]|jgi:hypothetical protein